MRRAWVFFAFVTLLGYGTSNFLASVIGKEAEDASNAGKSNGQVQLLTQGVAGLALTTAVLAVRGSATYRDWRTTAALLAAGVTFSAGLLVLDIALAIDFRMAPFITGVLPFNAVLLVVACWLLLGEATTPLQMVAIAVACAGLAVMATADTSPAGLHGLLYGFIVACCFAGGNFLIKYASLRRVADHATAVSVLWLAGGLTGAVFFAVETAANGTPLKGLGNLNAAWGGGASSRLYVLSACSGVLLTATIALMKLTVSLGPAAPGMAIANANAIGVLALNTLFFRPPVRTQQIVGLLLSIAGVAVLSVAGVAPKKATTSDAEPMMPASPMIG